MPSPTDRPTAPPEFDLEEWVLESEKRLPRAQTASLLDEPDSLAKLLEPTSEVRLARRPPIGEFLGLEAWAAQVRGNIVLIAPPDVLKKLPLDHRAGFLVSMLDDGSLDLETLIEISGMAREEVLAIMQELHDVGAIDFR